MRPSVVPPTNPPLISRQLAAVETEQLDCPIEGDLLGHGDGRRGLVRARPGSQPASTRIFAPRAAGCAPPVTKPPKRGPVLATTPRGAQRASESSTIVGRSRSRAADRRAPPRGPRAPRGWCRQRRDADGPCQGSWLLAGRPVRPPDGGQSGACRRGRRPRGAAGRRGIGGLQDGRPPGRLTGGLAGRLDVPVRSSALLLGLIASGQAAPRTTDGSRHWSTTS